MVSMVFFTKHFKNELILVLLKIISKNWRGGSTSKLMLLDQHYPDAKARWEHCKKKKKEKNKQLQANIMNVRAEILNKILTN